MARTNWTKIPVEDWLLFGLRMVTSGLINRILDGGLEVGGEVRRIVLGEISVLNVEDIFVMCYFYLLGDISYKLIFKIKYLNYDPIIG